MIDKLLSELDARYPLTELFLGSYAQVRANGTRFTVRAYRAEGLGHVSTLCARGFLGRRKTYSLIVVPTALDLPIYFYDRSHAMGNDDLSVSLYDTLLGELPRTQLQAVLTANRDLTDATAEVQTEAVLAGSVSKTGKEKHITPRLDGLAIDHLVAYLACEASPVTDANAKRVKSSRCVDGLVASDSPTANACKRALGEDATVSLFRKVLLPTEPCPCYI